MHEYLSTHFIKNPWIPTQYSFKPLTGSYLSSFSGTFTDFIWCPVSKLCITRVLSSPEKEKNKSPHQRPIQNTE